MFLHITFACHVSLYIPWSISARNEYERYAERCSNNATPTRNNFSQISARLHALRGRRWGNLIVLHIFLRCRGSFFERNDASNRAHVFLLWFCRSDKRSRRISPASIICGGKIITLGCLHDLKYPKNWERNWMKSISTHWMYVTLRVTLVHAALSICIAIINNLDRKSVV